MADQKVFADGEVLTAEDVNTHLNPSTADHIPYAVATGTIEVTGTGAATAGATMPLPVGRFTSTPVVFLTPHSSVWLAYRAGDTSSTQIHVGVRRYDGQTFSNTATVSWVAIQMTPDSAEG